MRNERNIKKKAQQQGRVFVKLTEPRPIHRELTHADYTLPEIIAMCADGWHVTHCQLQRTVVVDAVEVTLTGDDAVAAAAIEAETLEHQNEVFGDVYDKDDEQASGDAA